jgi:hypothetical protein
MTATPPAPSPAGPDRTQKGMAVMIGILCGTVAALASYILSRFLGGAPLIALGFSGTSFMAVTTLVVMIEKELGVL